MVVKSENSRLLYLVAKVNCYGLSQKLPGKEISLKTSPQPTTSVVQNQIMRVLTIITHNQLGLSIFKSDTFLDGSMHLYGVHDIRRR